MSKFQQLICQVIQSCKENWTLTLSVQDTLIIKGVAILCIIAHNFFHNIWPAPGENELTFSSKAFSNVVAQIGQNPIDFFASFSLFFWSLWRPYFSFFEWIWTDKKNNISFWRRVF